MKFAIDKDRRRRIFALSVPIIGGMASQNVLNLVDTAMVGRLGKEALAGVGMASMVNFLSIAFLMGLSSGVQAIASRRMGEGRSSESAVPLNAGLVVAVIVGVPLSVLLIAVAPQIFAVLIDDPGVLAEGIPYLRARLTVAVFVGANYAFRGFWNGTDRPKLYMRTLIVMHASNIVLSYILIFGKFGAPRLGSLGAGIGTAASVVLGTVLYLALGFRHARGNGLFARLPGREAFLGTLRVSVPSGIQQMAFAGGMVAFFWVAGQVGTTALAATNVLVNLVLVAILPGLGFGIAAASFVGQALGRGDPEDARRWGWEVSRIGFVVSALVLLPGLVAPDSVLRIFIEEPEALATARAPLQLVAVTIGFDAVGLILLNALLGAGAVRVVMAVAITLQWVFFLPFAWWLGAVAGFGTLGIWSAQIGYRGIQALIFAFIWRSDRWTNVEV